MFASLNPSRGDVFGGISAGIVALPLCLAFGAISGLGPEAGLYGAIAAGILASIFGGTPLLVTGEHAADRKGKPRDRCDWFPYGRRPAGAVGRATPRRLYPLCALSGDLRFH